MNALQQQSYWNAEGGHDAALQKNELVVTYGHLVKKVVRTLFPRGNAHMAVIDLDDLEQAGYMGLLEASERFDRTKGAKFETYALSRIRGAIQDELRKVDWVPRSVRKQAREMEKTMEQYRQRPNDSLRPVATDVGSVGMLRSPVVPRMEATDFSEEGPSAVGSHLPVEESTPHEALELQEAREEVIRQIEQLEKRERLIIALHYFEGLTFKEIGTILRISESRVSQLHSAIVERLRERILAHS
jgi:RNA polymerase sigma factor for flagellar operon FliA